MIRSFGKIMEGGSKTSGHSKKQLTPKKGEKNLLF